MRRRQPRLIRLVAGGAVLASGLAAWFAPGSSSVTVVALVVAAAGLVLGELLAVTLPVARGEVWRFSGAEVALAAAVLHLPGLSLWAASVVAGLVVLAVGRYEGRAGRTLEYAAASFVASTGLAAFVFAGLVASGWRDVLAGGAAVLAAAVLRHVLAAVAVALTARRSVLPLVRRRLLASGVFAVGNAAIGLLAAELAVGQPLGLFGLLVPAVLLVSSYEQQVRRSAQAGLYAELARAQERAGARSVDASAGIVLTVAARMLGGADVEMLLKGSEGLIRYVGDEAGLRKRTRVEPSALDAPEILRLLASGGVRLSRDSGRPECGVCIGRTRPPVAFLVARRPMGAPAFSRREAALVRALAGQAEPWLVGAVDADLDAAARTQEEWEGLSEVREAARRVLTGADARNFDADALVGELHALERAVAQLVGAAPQAADGTEPGDLALPTQRLSADWTTTGTLS